MGVVVCYWSNFSGFTCQRQFKHLVDISLAEMVTVMRWASLLTSSVYLFFFAEGEICQAVGPVAQFAANRSVHVPQQLSGFIPGETDGSQVYRRSAHFNHVLPYEGTIYITCTNMSRAGRGESSFVRLLCLLYYLNIMWADSGKLQLQSNLDPTESLSEIFLPFFFLYKANFGSVFNFNNPLFPLFSFHYTRKSLGLPDR